MGTIVHFNKLVLRVLILTNLSLVNFAHSQVPTYTIDPNFNTGELFRDGSPVYDFHVLEDGRYLVGGGFEHYQNPVAGFGMIFSNGNLDKTGGMDMHLLY